MFKRLIQSLTGKPAARERGEVASIEVKPAPDVEVPAELIKVYDVHGREVQITRAEWRDRVLLPQLQEKWSEPDALYGLVLNALGDGFAAEVDPASKQLLAIDPIVERGHVVRAIVLMNLGRLDEAERLLRDAAAKVGETGTILTNLAKVQDRRGDRQATDATLWKAILLDPNQDNGLGWWAAREREQGGDAAYVAALEKAAALPGSWRPTLWLARHSLSAGDIDGAIRQFRSVLSGGVYDSDALTTISGDLGNAGRIEEMVELVAPRYDLAANAPHTGFNLLQAYLQLDRLDEGEALLDRLYALNMPPFKQYLDETSQRYQDRRRETTLPRPVETGSLQIAQVPFDRPIWMYGLRDPDWLLPNKPADARKVLFLMLGKDMQGKQEAEEQREDDIGRLSRAIPLFLAESVYEWTTLHPQTLVAVVVGGGPVVFGAQDEEGERETAIRLAEFAELVVQGTIGQAEGLWTVRLTLRDTSRGELVWQEAASAEQAGLEAAVLDLEGRVLRNLGGARATPHDRIYSRPTQEQMQPYLVALAQSLMLSLVANEVVPKNSMWGERNMLEWPMRMALHWPTYAVPKLMYLSGISNAARYGSAVLGEFDERSGSVLRELHSAKSPLADLGALVLHAFGRNEGLAVLRKNTSDHRQLAWIERVTKPAQGPENSS